MAPLFEEESERKREEEETYPTAFSMDCFFFLLPSCSSCSYSLSLSFFFFSLWIPPLPPKAGQYQGRVIREPGGEKSPSASLKKLKLHNNSGIVVTLVPPTSDTMPDTAMFIRVRTKVTGLVCALTSCADCCLALHRRANVFSLSLSIGSFHSLPFLPPVHAATPWQPTEHCPARSGPFSGESADGESEPVCQCRSAHRSSTLPQLTVAPSPSPSPSLPSLAAGPACSGTCDIPRHSRGEDPSSQAQSEPGTVARHVQAAGVAEETAHRQGKALEKGALAPSSQKGGHIKG